MANSVTVSMTNDRDLNGVLTTLKWNTPNLTVSFPSSANFYGPNGDGTRYFPLSVFEVDPQTHKREDASFVDPHSNFQALNATQIAAARAALEFYSSVTLLKFTFITESLTKHADLRLAMSDLPPDDEGDAADGLGFFPGPKQNAGVPGPWEVAGDSWYDNKNNENPVRGNNAWDTIAHELGHTLGLKHGHDPLDGDVLRSDEDPRFRMDEPINKERMSVAHDSHEFSIMTYRSYVGGLAVGLEEEWGHAQTPMMYDIAALQHMYGANFSTNSGNTTYRWSPSTGETFINGVGQGKPGDNRILMTVWDGNGKDTYDLSLYTTNLKLDLRPGFFSKFSDEQLCDLGFRVGPGVHMARGNVANALLYQSDERSLIENAIGGTGNDIIVGNHAANKLNGGQGVDVLAGGNSNDSLFGGDQNDNLRGESGNDHILAGTGNDRLGGGDGADFLQGEQGNDTIDGGLGNDRIVGGTGNDQLIGGSGANQFRFLIGSGHDVVRDFKDDVDTISIDKRFGFATLQDVLDNCSSSGGDSTINLRGAGFPRVLLLGLDDFNKLANDIVLI